MNAHDANRFMERCLWLAGKGKGWVGPNPMVGCVVVKGGEIVGEGFHRRFGGPHAEILALKAAGRKARSATIVVSLEPCAHHGKTPPCVDAIIAAGIREVIAASGDPNPLVAGQGFRKLRAHGVKTIIGILRGKAEELNEKFFWSMKNGLPFVGIKVAQTLDGKIADAAGRSKWITTPEARAHGHRLRAEYDAVLIGAGTVIKDNPRLTVRHAEGKNPWRIVVDGRLAVSTRSRIFNVLESPTMVLTCTRAMKKEHRKVVAFEKAGVPVLGLDAGSRIPARSILRVLAGQGISSVLVEGGSGTVRPFLEARCVQKLHCFVAGKILGSGLPAFVLEARPLSRALRIENTNVMRIGKDFLLEGRVV